MATAVVDASVQVAEAEPLVPDSNIKEVSLEDALETARAAYICRSPISKTQHEEAVGVMPGGNTRSVLFNEPFPICMKQGRGNQLWDLDNHQYLDLVGEFTAGLYGHSEPLLLETMKTTYSNVGISLGATTSQEFELANLICQRYHSIENVRFCNSGTEANLYAVSIAKHITGKSKVIVFQGGYHGGLLNFGHGIAPNTVDKNDWVLGRYNDAKDAKDLIEGTPDVAAVLVEAMQGAGGCLPATVEFLKMIEDSARKSGLIFILDEVMTSRLHPSGLQAKYRISPDLTTFGKYMGGGLAFGAFGGRRDLLAAYDPRNAQSLPHSGTFNNNTLAMACGFVGLSQIYTPQAASDLNELGDYLAMNLRILGQGTKMVITGVGAVLTIHFLASGSEPTCATDIDEYSINDLKKLFWYWCLGKGFWITERGMLSIILGTTKEELDSFIKAVDEFVQMYKHLLAL